MQLLELREYAERRGWRVVGEYVDRSSGAKESRPALNRLMVDAHQRKFDVIAVWKIDRFGRSLKHLVNALAELEAVGVAFVSLRDNLDLGTPSRRLLFQIIAAMAEFERTLIAERVRGVWPTQRRRANGSADLASWLMLSVWQHCGARERPGKRSQRNCESALGLSTKP